ncbi:hypothetical protein UlMin_003810 [Ulmus minor]
MPDSLANLSSSLKYLNLQGNRLQRRFPTNIFLLPNLKELDLSSNNKLVGSLPAYNWSSPLQNLSLSHTKLSIDLPHLTRSLKYLNILSLSHCNFIRSYPALLGNFTNITSLDLSDNNFGGQIPWSSFDLGKLWFLRLSGNNFIGQLPNLSGTIDFEQFLKLERLSELDLSSNKYLSLSSNNFTKYTSPHNLYSLTMSSCNVSEFPYSLRTVVNLSSLDLSNNQIKGNVPEWLSNVGKDSLYLLDLSHNLLTNIVQIPWKNLLILDLRSNLLQGPLPIPPLNTNVFSFSNNQLTGEIPSLICNMSSLQVLDLSKNRFHGTLSPCIGNLQKNSTFAEENSNSLRLLNLNGNQLEESLPQTLLNCKSLQVLDLGNNQINDTFPYWLESLPILQVLILKSNKFHGSIPNPKVSLPFQKLRIVDLSYNEFDGLLPTKYFENFVAMMDAKTDGLQYIESGYYQVTLVIKGISLEFVKVLSIFTTIDLSRNKFEGEIPKSIEIFLEISLYFLSISIKMTRWT